MLAEGDLVSIDCGAIVDGWHGDAAISVIVGGRDAGRPEDLDAGRGHRGVHVGRHRRARRRASRCTTSAPAVEDSIVASGERRRPRYGIVEDYVGHGIGTDDARGPAGAELPGAATEGRTVAAGLSRGGRADGHRSGRPETRVLDDDWTVVTADGRRAAHWEHTVAVTDDGLWVLTALDGGGAAGGRRRAIRAPRPDPRESGQAACGADRISCSEAAGPGVDFVSRRLL